MHPYLNFKKIACLLALVAALQSCSYSVIVFNRDGSPEQDPLTDTLGFYNGKKLTVIDTVVSLSLAQNKVFAVPSCPSGSFYSMEYKITFGDMLRNTFTFGKKRGIKVKYVCSKNSN
nr:hypothetical protein [uncultured Mucilaginibacter sp.]